MWPRLPRPDFLRAAHPAVRATVAAGSSSRQLLAGYPDRLAEGVPRPFRSMNAKREFRATTKVGNLATNFFNRGPRAGDAIARSRPPPGTKNNRQYHESLHNVSEADAYFGRPEAIIKQRERIKRQTIEHRRLQHHDRRKTSPTEEPGTPPIAAANGAK